MELKIDPLAALTNQTLADLGIGRDRASRARILEAQRARRAKLKRIDYYPSVRAAAVIDAHIQRFGCKPACLLDVIIEDWAKFRNYCPGALDNSGIKSR